MVDSERFYCGVDAGSAWTKAVMVDGEGRVVGRGLIPTSTDYQKAANTVLSSVCTSGRDCAHAVATGQGKGVLSSIPARRTDIAMIARAVHNQYRMKCDVVEIGANHSKIIHLREDGSVEHFMVNRECAGGSGAFIEEIAWKLEISIDRFATLATNAKDTYTLPSCGVFASSKGLEIVRQGGDIGAVCRAALQAVVTAIASIGPLDGDVVLSGGVIGGFPVLASFFEEATGCRILTMPEPQLACALGAALESLALQSS